MAAPSIRPFGRNISVRFSGLRRFWRRAAITESGKIDDAALRQAEDLAIQQVVEMQRSLGLSSITDGEYRRHAYSDSFTVDVFDGVKIGSTVDRNWTYSDTSGRVTEGRVPLVVGRLTWPGPVNVDNFNFIAGLAGNGVPKITLPDPAISISAPGATISARRSIPISMISGTIWSSPMRRKSARCTKQAAAISSSTRRPSPSSATRKSGRDSSVAAMTGKTCSAPIPM